MFARGTVDVGRDDRNSPKAGRWSGSRCPVIDVGSVNCRVIAGTGSLGCITTLYCSLYPLHYFIMAVISMFILTLRSSGLIISENAIFRHNKNMLHLAGTENPCDDAGRSLTLPAEVSQPSSKSWMGA